MEKRFVTALALSVLILLGWSLIAKRYFPPPPPPPVAATSGPEAVPPAETPASPAPPTPAVSNAATAPVVSGEKEQDVRLDTDLAEIVLTNKGGRVRSWKLKQF